MQQPNELEWTQILVASAQNGDQQRLNELYARVANALYSWASLRIPPSARGRLAPEDVLQETWCRALRAFKTFDRERGAFRSWMFAIAQNVLLEALRDLGRAERARGDSTRAIQLKGELPDDTTRFTQRIASDDGVRRFLERVESIGDAEKYMVIACGLEGASITEVATRLKLPVETVKKRWQRLRAELVARGLPDELFSGDA